MDRDARILAAVPIAEGCARRLRLRGEAAEEARSVALAALVKAAADWDAGKAPWEPFATQRVKWALADWQRSELGRGRPRPKAMGDLDPGPDRRAADPADEADARDRRHCPHCERLVPRGGFYLTTRLGRPRLSPWCKACMKAMSRRQQKSAAGRRWRKAWRARPEVRERQRAVARKRAEAGKAKRKAYRATARAKLLHCRRQARIRLRAAKTPERREHYRALVGRYTRAIAELDARREAARAD